jgi:asparagine synthase (glutamine-hydrolysing)
MISDRGVGAWLSGGVDSSLVTYYMSQIQDSPVETFSVGFENKVFDESDHSRKISDTFKTNHNELIISGGVISHLHKITEVLDEPFADSSFIATYLLSEYTAKNRVVVLGGDGGDEAFGGYERYRLIKLLDSGVLASPLATYLIKCLSTFPFISVLPGKLAQLINVMNNGKNAETIYENFMTWIPKKSIDELLVSSNPSLNSWFMNSFTTMPQSKRGKEFDFNLWDIMNYLPSDLLPKVDLASMAFGLEVRSPFLDTKLFSFGLALPDSMRIRKSNTKYLLKKLALQKLPNSIVNRPKKGFGVPREEWLRDELRTDLQFTLSKSNVNLSEIIDINIAKSRLSAFNAGEKIDAEIWTLYMLGKWANHWL